MRHLDNCTPTASYEQQAENENTGHHDFRSALEIIADINILSQTVDSLRRIENALWRLANSLAATTAAAAALCCTGWPIKMVALHFCPSLRQLLTDFQTFLH